MSVEGFRRGGLLSTRYALAVEPEAVRLEAAAPRSHPVITAVMALFGWFKLLPVIAPLLDLSLIPPALVRAGRLDQEVRLLAVCVDVTWLVAAALHFALARFSPQLVDDVHRATEALRALIARRGA